MDSSRAAFEVLTSMITPVVLISASGMLVLSTSTRLSRVVDRTRVLAEKSRTALEDRDSIRDQIEWLAQRVLLLRSALTAQYLAIALFVTTSICLGIVAVVGWQFGWIPVAIDLLGALSLLYSSVLLIREARLAVASTLNEMTAVRKTVEKP